MGPPTGTPGEGMADENPGVEDNEIEGEEQDDHDFADLEVEDDENPGVVDHENEGVEQAGPDVYSIEAEGENQDNVSMETEKDENMTADQDCGDEKGAQGKPQYSLRKNCAQSYKHMYDPELYEMENKTHNEMGDVVLTTVDDTPEETPQMSMKKGLKMFGEGGYAAVKKEMQQLHDRKVMQPISQKDLSPEQKKEALGYLMFLKKKRCGKIKGRGCADGRKQQAYITKEQSTSPTISTEAVFLTAVVDAWENRKVAVLDVPGAFIQVDMDEVVHVRFHGEMVDKLLEIDHELYSSYITEEQGEKVMYMELLKALYGTLRAAPLFWEKLQAKLVKDWRFVPNRYDSCVVNKKVDGKQLTMAWHMDNLKVSHEEERVLDEFIAMMEEEFGQEAPLSVP